MDTNTRTHTHTPQTQTMTQKQQKQISGRFETGMGANIDTDTNTYRQSHEQRTSRHANTQNMSSPLCTGKKQTTAIVPNSNIHVHRNAYINTQTGSEQFSPLRSQRHSVLIFWVEHSITYLPGREFFCFVYFSFNFHRDFLLLLFFAAGQHPGKKNCVPLLLALFCKITYSFCTSEITSAPSQFQINWMLYNANHDGVVHFGHCLCVPKAESNIKRESHLSWWNRLVLFVQHGLRQNTGTD